MSRIGKKPVLVPKQVKVELQDRTLKVSGPQGSLTLDCHPLMTVKLEDGGSKIVVANGHPENRLAKQMYGTTRALIANMVEGVTAGYQKRLEIYGTGYNVKEQGGKLVLQVGYANAVEMPVPKGVKVQIEVPATKGNEVPAKFTVSGPDKCVVGQFASEIRKSRPPEPYKGKGIRFADEHIRRKVGKAFASGG